MAEEDEILEAFETLKRRFEASKAAFEVLSDAKKRGAYDRQRARKNEMVFDCFFIFFTLNIYKELKLKIDKLEIDLACEKMKNGEGSDDHSKLEKLRMELGELGGAGHFFGNDIMIENGGARNPMEDKDLKKVLQLLSLGEKKVNLKES